MKRTLVIFAVVVCALLAGGYVVFRALVATPSGGSSRRGTKLVDDQPPPGVPGIPTDATLTRPLPKPVDAGAARIAPRLQVRDVDGVVEYRGPNQTWKKVGPKTRLSVHDAIKTRRGAGITLVFDGGSTVRLDGQSEVSVAAASRERIALKLQRGRAAVDHQPQNQMIFRIESTETRSSIETKRAKFAVLGTSKRLAVAATRGQVRLTAKNKTVTVKEGQQSTVSAGETPRTPQRIPVSILLKVAQPRQRLIRQRYVVLSGQVAVGTELRINQTTVATNARGAFRVRLPLRLGRNRLVAVARDVAGRSKRLDLGVLIVRPKSTVTDVKVKWD